MPVKITDRERRLRVLERHHHARRAGVPEQAVRAVAALHSTDPATPYISSRARVGGFTGADLDDALYERRTLVRMHSIRRTLFLFDLEDAPWFFSGATVDIAARERARFAEMIAGVVPAGRVAAHLDRLTEEVREALAGRILSTRELIDLIPALAEQIEIGTGKWVTKTPVGTRLLLVLGMEGVVVRARPVGTWRSSQYRWARSDEWFDGRLRRADDEDVARAMVARRYLEAHAPATLADLRWWTGWTAGRARAALAALDVDEVELEHGEPAYQLSDDPGADGGEADTVAFLPSLDSSTMGWKERDWYLGPHGSEVFDNIGNAGPTIWLDGRIVGGWGQRPDGTVVYELLEEVPKRLAARVADEASSLGDWLGERVVMPRFPSPLGKRLSSTP